MRILHILDHSIPLHSGYTFRTAAILREQRALGWETFHLTSTKQGRSIANVEIVDGLTFYRTEPEKSVLLQYPLAREIKMMKQCEKRMDELVKDIQPDIIHAHSPVLNAIPALSIGRRHKIPVVYEIRAFWEDAAVDHGSTVEGSLRYRVTRALETWAMKRADHIFTICEGLRKDIVNRKIPSSKVTVIPNAVDIDAFQWATPPDEGLRSSLGLNGKTVLGFVGSFYAYEGLDLLVSALPMLRQKRSDIVLLLVGGGPQDGMLRAQAKQLGVENMVVFAGRVPHGEVGRYYNQIDLLVYPRHKMRLTDLVTPLKPLEAMAQGKVFVASDVGGHQELIEDGKTGVLFRAGDSLALTNAVVSLLDQTTKKNELITNGRRFVEQVRNWKNSVEKYREPYENLIN